MDIQIQNLSKSFDNGQSFALRNVNLSVTAGEFVAIIGPSGAGKSTLLRTLNGAVLPSSGSVEVLDTNPSKLHGAELAELRRGIGFIFQQFNLIKTLSALQNVLIGRIAHAPFWRGLLGIFSTEDKNLAKAMLQSVGLQDRYDVPVRELSGGQQQRVAVARALAQQPKIILADEPMASLDPRLGDLVVEMLAKIHREQSITVLMNIHSVDLAKKYAPRILGIRHGELVFDGVPGELTPEKIEEIYAL